MVDVSTLPPPPTGAGAPLPPPPRPRHARTTGPVRWTWNLAGAFAVVLTLFFGTHQVLGLLAHEEHTVALTEPAAGLDAIEVSTANGSVDIVGTDADVVRVTARVSRGLEPTHFTHRVVDRRLVVRMDCRGALGSPWCTAKVRIEVPRRFATIARLTDGHLDVAHLDGAVDARTGDGGIELDDVRAPVRLWSRDGSISVRDQRNGLVTAHTTTGHIDAELVVAPVLVQVHSGDGDVSVAIPRRSGPVAVSVTAPAGEARSDVPSDPAARAVVDASSSNGDAVVTTRA